MNDLPSNLDINKTRRGYKKIDFFFLICFAIISVGLMLFIAPNTFFDLIYRPKAPTVVETPSKVSFAEITGVGDLNTSKDLFNLESDSTRVYIHPITNCNYKSFTFKLISVNEKELLLVEIDGKQYYISIKAFPGMNLEIMRSATSDTFYNIYVDNCSEGVYKSAVMILQPYAVLEKNGRALLLQSPTNELLSILYVENEAFSVYTLTDINGAKSIKLASMLDLNKLNPGDTVLFALGYNHYQPTIVKYKLSSSGVVVDVDTYYSRVDVGSIIIK